MSDEALMRAFQACMIAAPEELRGGAASMVARGVPAEVAARLPEETGERLAIYRAMIHARLREVIAEYLPKTVARLGPAGLRREVEAFLAEAAPRSPYFRAVPGEFLAWARPRWSADASLPPWLGELAAHEWADAEVADCVAGGEPASGEPLALGRPVQLDGSLRLLRYAWAVHRATEVEPPPPEPTALLLYRDREHRVRALELTPRAAAVCARLIAGEALQAALTGACAELGAALDDEFLAAMAAFFGDLAERGALLGAR